MTLTAADLIGHNGAAESKYQMLLEWHGVHTNIVNKEFIGDCPFYDCPSVLEGKPDKFTMNRQTAEWQCFMCGRKGNAYGFIREVHRNSLEQTTPHHLQELRELRKNAIDLLDLVEMQLAFNPSTKEWTAPAWNVEGKIVNLYLWRESYVPSSGKAYRQFLSSPSMSHVPYGIHRIRTGTNRPIWVCEGQWDYLALASLFRRLDLTNKFDILAAPGAGTFPRKYLSVFNGREVIICYDNDPAGQAGTDSLIGNMASNGIMPTGVKRLEWPVGLDQGFDISDVITKLPQGLWKKQ